MGIACLGFSGYPLKPNPSEFTCALLNNTNTLGCMSMLKTVFERENIQSISIHTTVQTRKILSLAKAMPSACLESMRQAPHAGTLTIH